MLLNKNKRVHFIGVGGIGMSGIALILLKSGYKVSGSDIEPNSITGKIAFFGGYIFTGHRASNIPKDTGLVVYSTSIQKDNPEMLEARSRGIKIIHRAEMLAELFNRKNGIAVTGTHGKTTTTSLVSVMLESNGFDPTVMIGGEVDLFGANAKAGDGRFFVAEADESDGSFLNFKPFYSVITNLEQEHVDYYKTLKSQKAAYRSFADNLKSGGKVFYNIDDKNLRSALKGFKGKTGTFGFSRGADMSATDIKMDGFRASFVCIYNGKRLGTMKLNIPGTHNILNALASALVGLECGIGFKEIAASLEAFKGAKRRFSLRAESGGVMLIEDYAHHPTEIKAVLEACRNWKDRRVIAVFQPHRYTRTQAFAEDFGRCFAAADKVVLTDIYAASEEPIPGVSINDIYERAKRNGKNDVVVMKKEDIAGHILDVARDGDMVLILGAGDIKKVADELAEKMSPSAGRPAAIKKGLAGFLKGKASFEERFSRHTSFGIGGPADVWVEPSDYADLKNTVLFAGKSRIPLFVVGKGSNILVKDGGFRGIVIELSAPFFRRIDIKGRRVKVGAGFRLPELVRFSCDNGLAGLESLVGIPGTIGGAICMNAGGAVSPLYKNIGDFVVCVKVMDYRGRIKTLKKQDISFGYRCSSLDPYIILEATLELRKGAREELLADASKFLKLKKNKQVLDIPSAGCIFKNPKGSQFTCGQMIDMLGLKGSNIGGAEVSGRHANFIVNRSNATCSDVLKLIDLIRDKVRANYDVDLELEVKVI